MSTLSPFAALRFDNRFVREMPADTKSENSRRQVTGAAYSRVSSSPVKCPSLLTFNAVDTEEIQRMHQSRQFSSQPVAARGSDFTTAAVKSRSRRTLPQCAAWSVRSIAPPYISVGTVMRVRRVFAVIFGVLGFTGH